MIDSEPSPEPIIKVIDPPPKPKVINVMPKASEVIDYTESPKECMTNKKLKRFVNNDRILVSELNTIPKVIHK